MKDKGIRNILIAYLKATYSEVRIYQEKSIGSAICDVMAVTDKMIGYEIKSDADNYQRLEGQVAVYDMFFDINYIVVSQKHIASAESKVPRYWGIIYIVDNDIRVLREASKNPKMSRRRQLSVLWKVELKNLLIKNNLPLYAQKEKGYIADRIYQQVEEDILGKQIVHELLQRDYSFYNAQDYSIYSKQNVYENMPAQEIVDTLSEQDFEQITLDKWIELYQNAKEIQQQKTSHYEKQEIVRPPHTITYKDIEVSLGAPWISKDIINSFTNYLITGSQNFNVTRVEYEPVTGAWFIEEKRGHNNARICAEFGTMRMNALFILESTLNLREIKLYDSNGDFNEADTIAALEKQRLIIEEFRKWVWEDEDRKWQIEESYNQLFSAYDGKQFDGSQLTFPEMNPEFELFDYQKDAVQRIISTRNTLLAFDVGAGKTYIMIAAAMKMREMGLSRKNLFVVPNNIVGQWEKIFTTLYPKAKVLAVEPRTFKPEMRNKVLMQIKNGDYDGIIIAYSCFELIPLSVEYITNRMRSKMDEIYKVINDHYKNVGFFFRGETSLRREIQHIETLSKELIQIAQSQSVSITFESLEINTIFLDEAHNFKNIPIQTKLKNLRGINVNGSRRCLQMLQKIRCVQESNDGRGAVLATGTPLCNSISDAYTMQMYLQYDELCKHHFERFDNWVKTFAQPEQVCEIDVTTANYRFVRRFSRFFNLRELSKMFSEIAIFYSMDNEEDLPENIEYIDVPVKKSERLNRYMGEICERAEAIREGIISPRYDNMLKVSTDGRKAALDLTLVGKVQPYDEHSKLVQCVHNVVEIANDYPGCSQLIFCDYSTPKANEFNVYQKIKELLMEQGMQEKDIAFVHSYKSESTRLKLYENANSGKLKVLIGSTFKLGIGANVQTKLKAIHHLDVPWRPADMTQREGRILRRGNENSEVSIFRYIAEGSFDAYSWQILETKQRFISQFLSGSSYQKSIEDLDDNVLTYAEVKAIALANPIMKQIAEKENEIKTLQILVNKDAEDKQKRKERLATLDTEIQSADIRYAASLKNEAYLQSKTNEMYLKEIKLSKGILTRRHLLDCKPGETILLYFNFKVIAAQKGKEGKLFVVLRYNDADYLIQMGESADGNIKRITNFFKHFDKVVEKEEENLRKMIKEKTEIQRSLGMPNPYIDKLKQSKRDLAELMRVAERSSLVKKE